MIPRRLSTAILGTGQIAPAHIRAVRATGLADVVALAGSDADRTAVLADEWDVPRSISTAAAIADETIDVVHVVGTNERHAGLAVSAIEAGKHVVVEKPLALSIGDAEAIVDAATRGQVKGMTAFTYWGIPEVQALRSRVQDGAVGDIHIVHGSYLQDWLAADSAWDWRCDPVRGGASRALADIGTHWFSLVEFVTGTHVEAVTASLSRAHAQRADAGTWRPVANEDSATVLFRLSGGGHGSLVVSQVSHGHGNHLSVEVTGASGTLSWETEDPASARHRHLLERAGQSGASSERGGGLDFEAALGALVDAFYHDVQGRTTSTEVTYPTLADGARSVAIVDAALRSVETAAWCDVRPGGRVRSAEASNAPRP